MRSDTIIHSGCAYHFSADNLPLNKYLDILNTKGEDIALVNPAISKGEDLSIIIQGEDVSQTLYAGKFSGYDRNKSCTIFLKDSAKGLCIPELHSEVISNFGKLDFQKYKKLLMQNGISINEFNFNSVGYDEVSIAEGSIGNELLFISSIIYHDPDKQCDYMVRNNQKVLCSAELAKRIEDDVAELLQGKWLARILRQS